MAELDLDDWIATGTVARKTVPIYNDPGAIAEAEALLIERAAVELEVKEAGGERSLTDADPLADIDARLEALHARFAASVTEWTLGPVIDDDYDAIQEKWPEPPGPRKPLATADEAAQKAYRDALAAWRIEAKRVDGERNVAYVAASVLEVRAGDRVAHGATPEQVRALRRRPGGTAQFNSLLAAAIAVTKGEVGFPVPKS